MSNKTSYKGNRTFDKIVSLILIIGFSYLTYLILVPVISPLKLGRLQSPVELATRIIMTLLFLVIIKFMQSAFVWNIEFDKSAKELKFGTTLGNVKIKPDKIAWWRIRRFKTVYPGIISSAGRWTLGCFECKLTSGKLFYYPYVYPPSDYETFFKDTIGKAPVTYNYYGNPIIFDERAKPSLREKVKYQLALFLL